MATQNVYSVSLDGSTDAFSHADHVDFKPTGAFSVGAWIKTTTTGTTRGIISSWSVNTDWAGWELQQHNDNKIYFYSGKNSGAVYLTDYTQIFGGTTITDGKWHFVVATSDGTNLKLYVDGVSDATPVGWANHPAYAATNYVRVGCRKYDGDAESGFFTGNLDGVFLINGTALTQAQIATLMLQDFTGTTNLKAYYKFENNDDDSSGQSHDLTPIGTPTYDSGADDVPFTYYLESTDNLASLDLELSSTQYASIADGSQTGLDFSTTFTLEGWFKFETLPSSSYQYLIAKDTTDHRSYAMSFFEDGLFKFACFVFNGANVDYYYVGASSIVVNEWVHLAVTCDVGNASATTFEFFINGISQGNGTAINSDNISSITDSTASFYIGENGNIGTFSVDGKIDDVRAWSDVRTATEIRENMNIQIASDEAGLVSNWKFDGDYTDENANANTLTASGSPIFVPDQAFDVYNRHSLDLELSSSQYAYIADNASLSITGDLTIEAWVKIESLPGSDYVIIEKGDSGSFGYVLFIDDSNSDKLTFWFSDDGSSYGSQFSANTGFVSGDVGVWKHIAVSVDVSTPDALFYVNGSLVASTDDATADTSIFDNAENLAIGSRGDAGLYFDGQIDDVRIWNDIRTPSEIDDNKDVILDGDEAGLVSNWRLDNNYADITSNGNHLTPVNTPTFNWIVPYDGGIAFYSKSLTETITITDSLAKFPKRTLLESISIVDSVDRTKIAVKDFSESITLTDAIAKKASKAQKETITIVEALAKKTSRSLPETITIAEVFAKIHTHIRSFTETITLTDTFARAVTYARNLTETITITDSIKKVLGKAYKETVTMVATFAKLHTHVRGFTETITIHDRIRKYLNGLLISIWSKIEKQTTTYTKSAKPTTVFTKVAKSVADIWTKREKPEA